MLSRLLLLAFCLTLSGVLEAEETQAAKSEDQWVAEAIWAYVLADGRYVESVEETLVQATERFPRSARLAYWRACLAREAETLEEVFDLATEVVDKVDETIAVMPPAAPDEGLHPPSIRPQLRSLRQLVERRRQEGNSPSVASDELMLQAVELDPKLFAGWLALVNSSDHELAVEAADTWARLEPDNALPLYGKAAVLFRDCLANEKPVSEAVVEAIEAGNERSACRAPQIPLPTEFTLVFSPAMQEIKEACPELVGENVPEPFLHYAVEQLLSQYAAVITPAVSLSTFRQMFHRIAADSQGLAFEKEVQRLRMLVQWGLHLQRSNRLLYVHIDEPAAPVLDRLESLATSREDSEAAQRYRALKQRMRQTSRKVSAEYLAQAEREERRRKKLDCRELVLKLETHDFDAAAAKTMMALFKDFDVPRIRGKE